MMAFCPNCGNDGWYPHDTSPEHDEYLCITVWSCRFCGLQDEPIYSRWDDDFDDEEMESERCDGR